MIKDGVVTPQLGEIKRGKDIGRGNNQKVIWVACAGCGRERWVQYKNGKPESERCMFCCNSGQKSPMWKGGKKRKGSSGYISVKLDRGDFFYSMADCKGYVGEHRLVMAKSLGRCLHRWEIVHHKNHIRDDNRIENLQCVSDDRHRQITILERRIKYLEDRVTILEAENVLLKSRTTEGATNG